MNDLDETRRQGDESQRQLPGNTSARYWTSGPDTRAQIARAEAQIARAEAQIARAEAWQLFQGQLSHTAGLLSGIPQNQRDLSHRLSRRLQASRELSLLEAGKQVQRGHQSLLAGDVSQALLHARQSLNLAREASDGPAQAAAHRLLAAIMTVLGETEKAQYCFKAAEQATEAA